MNDQLCKVVSIASLAASCFCLAFSQARLPEPKLHSLIMEGIDLTWQEQYQRADSVFQVLVREFPNHPAGYVYRAGLMQSRAMDNEMELDAASFDSLIDTGKNKAHQLVESGIDKTWGYFFLGTADGSDSYARVYRGDWFGGTRKGFASVSSFKESLKLDSTLHDAEAGIGAFYYWRSRKTEYFNWIPFVGDDRPESLLLLKRSIEKGVYNKYTALSMLVAIYIDAGTYEEAIGCSREGLNRYPNNRTFLWGLATACQKSELWPQASAAYKQLLERIILAGENNHYNELVCRLNLARVSDALGDSGGALRQLDDLLKLRESDFPKYLQDRAKEKLEQANSILRRLSNKDLPANRR